MDRRLIRWLLVTVAAFGALTVETAALASVNGTAAADAPAVHAPTPSRGAVTVRSISQASAIESVAEPGLRLRPPDEFVAPRTVATGGARVSHLGDDVVRQVDDAIERAAQGKVRFPGHDGKVFDNADRLLPSAGPGYYSEWTAAASGAKRGTHRVIVGGNPASPDAIYYWDHAGNYLQVWP